MMRYDSRFLYSGARGDWMRRQAPDLAAVSPINAVSRFSTPLLMLHGAKDQVVPVKQSRSLAQKLKAAGKPATYIEQPQADHHFSRAEDRLHFLQALEAFLKAHNPA
jgi:dipeptidyl aminopeptidase/acylaminoacyl peptidase